MVCSRPHTGHRQHRTQMCPVPARRTQDPKGTPPHTLSLGPWAASRHSGDGSWVSLTTRQQGLGWVYTEPCAPKTWEGVQ